MNSGPRSDRPMAEKSAAEGAKASVMLMSCRARLSSALYAISNLGMAAWTSSLPAPSRTRASFSPSREAM